MTLFGTTRHSGYDFETERADSWRERAACKGEDPDIFHRLSPGDPGTKGLNQNEIKKLEIKNFAKALKICAGCPVQRECEEEGSVQYTPDGTLMNPGSLYSVYGGNAPDGWAPTSAGRPRKADHTVPLEQRKCVKGHVGQWRRDGTGYRCRVCVADRKREAYGLPPSVKMTPEERHRTDPKYGHEYEPGVMAGKRVCKECRRQVYRRWRENQSLQRNVNPDKVRVGTFDYDARHEQTKGHSPDWKVKPNGRRYCRTCDQARDRSKRPMRDTRLTQPS